METVYHKISEASRNLLLTLFSLSGRCLLEDLKKVFLSFHSIRSNKYRSPTSSMDFQEAFRELEGSFISLEKIADCTDLTSMEKYTQNIVSFHNPSVEDLLKIQLQKDTECILDIIASARFFDQCIVMTQPNTTADLKPNLTPHILAEAKEIATKLILHNSELIARRMLDLFTSETCTISYQLSMFGGFVKDNPNYLLRFYLTTQVFIDTKNEKILESLKGMLNPLTERMYPSERNRRLLVDILNITQYDPDIYSIIKDSEYFLYSAADILLIDLNDIDDLEILEEFRDLLDIDQFRYELAIEDFIRNYNFSERYRGCINKTIHFGACANLRNINRMDAR